MIFFSFQHVHQSKILFKPFFQLIQQELNIDGLLDINIPISNQNSGSHTNTTTTTNTIGSLSLSAQNQTTTTSHAKVQYPQTSVTPPSWVH